MSVPAPRLFSSLRNTFAASSPGQPPSSGPTPADMAAFASAMPLAVDEATQTLNPPSAVPAGSSKEARDAGVSLERPTFDQVGGLQHVEQEKNLEMPPEVDGYLKKIETHQDQLPQEVVIADLASPVPTTKYLAKSVVILPITPEIEKKGAHQPPQNSIRWLIEWSHKIMKMFSGTVIYRQAEGQ